MIIYPILNTTGQLWRFTTNNKLVNKRFAIWQFSREKWDWDDTHGWLKNKRRYYQLTLPQHDTSQGAQISLTNWQSNWESWKKSRPITLEGDTNQWFTLYNVRSKRYLTAATQRSTQIRGQCYINRYQNLVINMHFSQIFFSSDHSSRCCPGLAMV